MPILLLLLLLFFVPWIGLVFFLVLGIFLLALIPLGFAAGPLLSVLARPSRITSLFFDSRIKKVHALEHGTCHVLARRGYVASPGEADRYGFSLRCGCDPSTVLESSREALELLKSGHRELAVFPRCGATLVATNLCISVIFLGALALSGHLGLFSLSLGLLLSYVSGPILLPFVQRWLTTDSDVESLSISGVELKSGVRQVGGFSVIMSDMVYVSVQEERGVIEAEVI
ncbi:DUF6391 domain-containing protein [Dethiosulfovibrio salsuginis]|uniref:Uncharacterized protein n=1 Tax=Dethiosulfovibrio salsuginis TaxID=561720 RepID=A0A1X7JRC2_9BACT|nr:DUF6391 domain-containing protein [Dethiosulfovibrio salsuginis]SMG30893.1 hypothetical protein SAMN06275492_11550 [Dethiosulfovibrio salsuginis]